MSRNSPHTRNHRLPYLLGLTAIFLAEWIILAVHPVNRIDWLAENILVALAAVDSRSVIDISCSRASPTR
ncbi:hypothetical protein [Methylomagnum sp.]